MWLPLVEPKKKFYSFFFHLVLVLNLPKGASINYVDKQGGGSGLPNVNDTTEAYLVNLSTKG